MSRGGLRGLAVLACLGMGACPAAPPRPAPPPVSLPKPAVAAPTYAASPLTAFAEEITTLAVAAVEGKPLPMVSFPLWASDVSLTESSTRGAGRPAMVRYALEGEKIVEYRRAGGFLSKEARRVLGSVHEGEVRGPRVEGPVTPLAFLVSLTAYFPQAGGEEAGLQSSIGVDAVFRLSAQGLRVVRYAVNPTEGGPGALPPSLAGKPDDVFVPLLRAIRGAELPANLLGEAERRAIAGKSRRARLAPPDPDARRRYQRRLAGISARTPAGYRVNRVGLVVRDRRGKRRFLRLAVQSYPRFGLRRPPLVRTARPTGRK